VCPGCNHKWEETQCLACLEVSRHVDWYHFPDEASQHENETMVGVAGA